MTKTIDPLFLTRKKREELAATKAFDICGDFPVNEWGLPVLWITVPVYDEETGNLVGRERFETYPRGFEDSAQVALYYGACYYREAMTYNEPKDHDLRVQCFRAAEVLYLHAAARGDSTALCNLGYVYSYDRCEGNYWPFFEDDGKPTRKSREEKAYYCYREAAIKAEPEGCYKFGDMLRNGTLFEPDYAEAFVWYRKAWGCGSDSVPVVWGSIAFRLARCYEYGEGCEQSFANACEWYEKAVTGLEIAVNQGEGYYRKVLSAARDGLARVKQELSYQ